MQTETKRQGLVDSILMEIEQEAVVTKRLLDIIPEDKLSWRPHPKAKTLGGLAMHLATLQGSVAESSSTDITERPMFPPDPQPKSREEILRAFADSQAKAKKIVASTTDERALAEWKLVQGERTILSMPRASFWRSVLLNHNYHHRGQLSTYLRQLDVELPSIYGPTADVDPFA